MKNTLASRLAAVLVFAAVGPAALAVPVGNSNLGREYLVNTAMLSHWSVGAFYETGTRAAVWDISDIEFEIETDRCMVYAGYDLLRWVTPFATLGTSETQLGISPAGGGQLEWGVGLHFNIIDQDILDPGLLEDRLRLNANVYYSATEAEWFGVNKDLAKLTANVLVGLVNEIEGNKDFWPEAIALYAGPVYSRIISDDFSESEDIGFTVGLDMFLTKRIALELSTEVFDDPSFAGGVHVRF